MMNTGTYLFRDLDAYVVVERKKEILMLARRLIRMPENEFARLSHTLVRRVTTGRSSLLGVVIPSPAFPDWFVYFRSLVLIGH